MASMIEEDGFAAVASRAVRGGRLLRYWPLTGGVSAITHALEIEGPDGDVVSVVVRRRQEKNWKPHTTSEIAKEFVLLESLRQLGFEAPMAYWVDDSGEIFPTPYYVMAFVEGTTKVEEETLADALGQMARFLARLHAVDIETMDLLSMPELEDPIAGALEYLPDDEFGAQLRAHLSCRPAWVSANPRSLLHGDFWPGNILWRDERIAAVIDWEDATLGDPLSDLAAARVELLCQYDHAAMERFTQYYVDQTNLDLSALPVWEVYVSAAALAAMSQWGLRPEDEAERRRWTRIFMERAGALLLEDS